MATPNFKGTGLFSLIRHPKQEPWKDPDKEVTAVCLNSTTSLETAEEYALQSMVICVTQPSPLKTFQGLHISLRMKKSLKELA